MGLETANTILDLNPNWPLATDAKSQGDDHIRLIKSVLQAMWPVGSVYMTSTDTNPGTFIGGTWAQKAQGRALVGVGDNGQSTWTPGQTRGSETHALTAAEMPAHAHVVDPPYTETTTNGQHGHYGNFGYLSSGTGSPTGNLVSIDISGGSKDKANVNIPEAGNHKHGVDIAPFWSQNTGSNAAHNNVQPSIAVYVWERTE